MYKDSRLTFNDAIRKTGIDSEMPNLIDTRIEKNKLHRLSRKAKVRLEFGLHARPASRIVQRAQHAKSNIWLVNDDKIADGKSVIDILMLECGKGKQVTVKAEDLSDTCILDDIVSLIENAYDENV